MKYVHLNEFKNYFALAWSFAAIYFLTDVTSSIQIYHSITETTPVVGEFSTKVQVFVAQNSVEMSGNHQFINPQNGIEQTVPLHIDRGIGEKDFVVSCVLREGENKINLHVNAWTLNAEGNRVESAPLDTTIVTSALPKKIYPPGIDTEIPAGQSHSFSMPEDFKFNHISPPNRYDVDKGLIKAGNDCGDFELVGVDRFGNKLIYRYRVIPNEPPRFKEQGDYLIIRCGSRKLYPLSRYIEDPEEGPVQVKLPGSVFVVEGLEVLQFQEYRKGWFPLEEVVFRCSDPPLEDIEFALPFRDAEGNTSKLNFHYLKLTPKAK